MNSDRSICIQHRALLAAAAIDLCERVCHAGVGQFYLLPLSVVVAHRVFTANFTHYCSTRRRRIANYSPAWTDATASLPHLVVSCCRLPISRLSLYALDSLSLRPARERSIMTSVPVCVSVHEHSMHSLCHTIFCTCYFGRVSAVFWRRCDTLPIYFRFYG